MSNIDESFWTGFRGYMVTAECGGDYVQSIVAVSPDKDYSLSASERRRLMHDAIRTLAFDKFGEGATVNVSWVKATTSTLHL